MSALPPKVDIAERSERVPCARRCNSIHLLSKPAQLERAHSATADGRILATILQFERFRVDVSDGALRGRTL
jgi:hypothetical protein